MRKTVITLLAAGLFSTLSTAQEKLPYIYSTDSINLGIEAHDEEDFERAIKLYSYVEKGDTNYEWAVYEKTLSLVQNKQYEEAIELAKEGRSFKDNNEGKFYNLQATSYDLLGNQPKAIELYGEAIERFPLDYNLYFNRAVVYDATKDYNLMVKDLQKALEINPYHGSSHLALARLALNEEQYAQALLSLGIFLVINPNTQQANDNIVYFNKALTDHNDLEPNGVVFGNEETFSRINKMITSYIALRSDYSTPSKIEYSLVNQMYLAITQSLKLKERKGFWENYYLPLYEQIMDSDQFAEFSYRILISSGNSKHQKIFKKNEKKIIAFKEFIAPLIQTTHELHNEGYISSNPEIKNWYYDNDSRVEAIGKVSSEGSPTGPYVFYYRSGAVSSKGAFNDEGNRDGVWETFYPNGNAKGKNEYKNGELHGVDIDYYENGIMNVSSGFKNDERYGLTKVFNESGTLDRAMNFENGEIEDSIVYYYDNGQVSTYYPTEKGLTQGESFYYYPDGKLSTRHQFKDDIRNGPFTGYFSNGDTYSKGSYKNNEYDSLYTVNYPNGNVSSTGNYKEGTKVGAWTYYFYDGKLKQTETLDEKGKKSGKIVNYDYNGRTTSAYVYDKGNLVSYEGFDKEGNSVRLIEAKKGKLDLEIYSIEGVKTAEGTYEGEVKTGKWKYYTQNGTLDKIENYNSTGELDGEMIWYFINGQVARNAMYKDDALNGYDVSYFDNGQLKEQGYNWKGKAYGKWLTYSKNGNIRESAFYVNGRLNGPYTWYNIMGERILYEEFDMGLLLNISSCNDDTCFFSHDVNYPEGSISRKYPNGKTTYERTMIGTTLNGDANWWYGNGQKELKGTYLDDDRHGEWTWYHFNGKVRTQGLYAYGDQIGVWKKFYSDGTMSDKYEFKNGEIHGEYLDYHENGKVEIRTEYFQGEMNGKRYFYDEQGEINHIRIYDQGRIIGYSHLGKDGKEVPVIPIEKETAEITSYYPNGQISRKYQLLNGNFDGEYVVYAKGGQVMSKEVFELGNNVGTEFVYYANGNVKSETPFVNGLKDGEVKTYFKNGKLKTKETYANGERNGIYEEYNVSGKLVHKYNFNGDFLYEEL